MIVCVITRVYKQALHYTVGTTFNDTKKQIKWLIKGRMSMLIKGAAVLDDDYSGTPSVRQHFYFQVLLLSSTSSFLNTVLSLFSSFIHFFF